MSARPGSRPGARRPAARSRAGGAEVRALTMVAEFEACVQLQKRVWRFDDADLVPARMFVVAHKIGGQVFGAFLGEELAGYALALPGERNGRRYLHSHMLAVSPALRNGGLGRRLKLRQREDALARGIELMEWTFDPLEAKNAYFNLNRLGAIARRYLPNLYGITSSALHAGLPTDRLVAEWWLRSRRVEGAAAALAGGAASAAENAIAPNESVESVGLPADLERWKAGDEARAAAAQATLRERLRAGFRRGLCALAFARDGEGGGEYRLGRWDEAGNKAGNENWNYGAAPGESGPSRAPKP